MAKVSRPFDHSTTDFEQAHPRFSPLLSIYSKSYASIFLPQQIMINKPQLQLRSDERKAAREVEEELQEKIQTQIHPRNCLFVQISNPSLSHQPCI